MHWSRPLRTLLTLRLGCAALLSSTRAAHAAGDIAVIAHPGVLESGLSLQQIRTLMLGQRQFWDRTLRVTLLIRAPVARQRSVVLEKIYAMTEAQFRQYWIAKVFRAEIVSGPKTVYSDEMSIQLVAAIPGSIAFVSHQQMPPGVNVLKIDDALPGEAEYPLR